MKMPVLFLSHGSPMAAVDPGAAGLAWQAAAQDIARPKAIVMVSAHWETNIPMLTGAAQPATIHDFGGFPDELYRIRYAAPGAPALAERVQGLLRAAGICPGIDAQRGLDHGAWVPLLHMYPQADIPVIQLSVQPELYARHHLAMGRALAPLRDEGVLIIASGHMTHNLRDYFRHSGQQSVAEYAASFRNWVDAQIMGNHFDALQNWESDAPGARQAHPSTEHFLPIFVAIGAALGNGETLQAERLHEGFEGGVLAMDAYRFN